MDMPHLQTAAALWDIHRIQQVYLTYAASMDSHAWDLMDQCFLEDAEIRLSALAVRLSGGVEVLSFREWQAMCRAIDPSFDMIQHFLYPPLIDLAGDVAHTRVYFVAQHVKNALAPDSFFTLGGWYDGKLVRRDDDWRLARHELVDTWTAGNPAVLHDGPIPLGAADRVEGHGAPFWLTARGPASPKDS